LNFITRYTRLLTPFLNPYGEKMPYLGTEMLLKKSNHFFGAVPQPKDQRKIMIFGNFEMSPRCHGNGKFQPGHVVTKEMVKSTFVPSLVSIEAVVIVYSSLNL
jgi:hypothetical protein